jgi:hypothetical protein
MGQLLHVHCLQQANNKQILEKDTGEDSLHKFVESESGEEEGGG